MNNDVDFYIKQGNTNPILEVQLKDNTGEPVDLSGATVRFQMKRIGEETLSVDRPAIITDPSNGFINYSWNDEDTEVAGSYLAEFDVDYSGGEAENFSGDETFPNNDYLTVRVEENL